MSTNYKAIMLAILKGEYVEKIPWIPRLDLWYSANKLAGTLPSKYKNASLVDIVDDLDWGYHAILPNFRDLRNYDDDIHRALGVYNLWNMPIKTVFENVTWKVTRDRDKTVVEYETPKGTLSTETIYDENMRKSGISISHVHKCVFGGPESYDALGYLFENARVEPNYEGFHEYADYIGRRLSKN